MGHARHPLLSSVAALVLAGGCGGDGGVEPPPPPHATKLVLVTQPPGQAQSGVALSAQPAVQLQDDQGSSVAQAGVAISVSIASGGGSLTGTTTVNTSSDGRASFTGLAIRGTIGPRILTFTSPALASVSSGSISLSAGLATLIAAQEGNQQTVVAGAAVAVPPSVIVTDADNNPVGGILVTFEVTAGGGSVAPATPVSTNANGIAAVTSWTLGTTPGPNTLSARADGLTGSPVVFTAAGGPPEATIRGTITISSKLLAQGLRAGTMASTPKHGIGILEPFSPKGGLSQGPRLDRILASAFPFRLPEYTPDELIVTFRPSAIGAPPVGSLALASRSTAALMAAEIGSRMVPHLSAYAATLMGVSPAVLTARIRVKNPNELTRVAAALRIDRTVATVERNGIVRSASLPTKASNDPLYPYQAWNYAMIDLPEAWSMTTGSPTVLVGVIDDGIRFDHPGIAANLTSDGYDFVSNPFPLPLCSGGNIELGGDGDGYDPDPTMPVGYDFDPTLECLAGPQSAGNHGLHVAGTIGAVGNDGVGVSGVNWTVRIRPVRVLGIYGSGTQYDVAQGILYAAGLPADDGAGGFVQAPTGAKILNLSLAGPDVRVLHDAVIAATSAGALLIAAAGNTGTTDPQYPAAYPEVMSVSSVGPDRVLASYSSFGSRIDIAAPGGDIGDGDLSFGVLSTLWDFRAGVPIYGIGQGTSMAAPHVAGVAALLLAQNPGLTRSELRTRLTDYAVDVGSPGDDDRYGAGIVNARNSLARNLGPPRQLRARLYDALTGRALQTVAVAVDGSYSFPVGKGSYEVFAGQDEDGDQEIGLPGRRWSAFGGPATPTVLDVNGPGTRKASFQAGFPSELEPNRTFDEANVLPVGGYLQGRMTPTDADFSRVLIPEAGQYTFQTSAVDGACAFGLEEDTVLRLYDSNGTQLDLSDDIDTTTFNFCSRITATLQPGTYYIGVQGLRGGRYRVQLRSGS